MGELERRQGSTMNAPLRGAPLTPLPAREGEVSLDNADDFIEGPRLFERKAVAALRPSLD